MNYIDEKLDKIILKKIQWHEDRRLKLLGKNEYLRRKTIELEKLQQKFHL